jgi:hypothetical protein
VAHGWQGRLMVARLFFFPALLLPGLVVFPWEAKSKEARATALELAVRM